MYEVLWARWVLPLTRRTSNGSPSYVSQVRSPAGRNSGVGLPHLGHPLGGRSPLWRNPQTVHLHVLSEEVLFWSFIAGAVSRMFFHGLPLCSGGSWN